MLFALARIVSTKLGPLPVQIGKIRAKLESCHVLQQHKITLEFSTVVEKLSFTKVAINGPKHVPDSKARFGIISYWQVMICRRRGPRQTKYVKKDNEVWLLRIEE